jgi:hypothetical protein
MTNVFVWFLIAAVILIILILFKISSIAGLAALVAGCFLIYFMGTWWLGTKPKPKPEVATTGYQPDTLPTETKTNTAKNVSTPPRFQLAATINTGTQPTTIINTTPVQTATIPTPAQPVTPPPPMQRITFAQQPNLVPMTSQRSSQQISTQNYNNLIPMTVSQQLDPFGKQVPFGVEQDYQRKLLGQLAMTDFHVGNQTYPLPVNLVIGNW